VGNIEGLLKWIELVKDDQARAYVYVGAAKGLMKKESAGNE